MTFTPLRPNALKLATLALLLAPAVWAPSPAAAEDGPYAVSKLVVDATAKDAVAAKERGMAQAEARAVRIVLKRLVPFAAYPQLPDLTQDDVEEMVKNVSFRREQNSTTRYLATLDVSISGEAVKQLLTTNKLPYSETLGPRIAILPVVFEGDTVKREGAGGWRQAWTDLDLLHSMVPADLVDLQPSLDAATLKTILAGNAAAYAKVRGEYGDRPLVIAVGEGVEGGKFATRLVGVDAVGEINFGRTDQVQGGDFKTAARNAAIFGFGVLEGRWKVMQSAPRQQANHQERGPPGAPAGEPERNVVAVVEFSGLKEWQAMRTQLMNIAGIQGLEVSALSARSASITFDYAGSLGHLQKELDQHGFIFENREDNLVVRTR
jgi:hypothetical protein